MNPCIFSQFGQHPFRYDVCRECKGYTEGCLNYLSEYKYSKPIQSPLTNPVLGNNDAVSRIDGDTDTRKSPRVDMSKQEPYLSNGVSEILESHSESYSKPFYFGHVELYHTVVLPKVKNFMRKFREEQR